MYMLHNFLSSFRYFSEILLHKKSVKYFIFYLLNNWMNKSKVKRVKYGQFVAFFCIISISLSL